MEYKNSLREEYRIYVAIEDDEPKIWIDLPLWDNPLTWPRLGKDIRKTQLFIAALQHNPRVCGGTSVREVTNISAG